MTAGFHPGRLAGHADEIRAMVADLPDEFDQGWSFLNMPLDRRGEQWGGQSGAQNLALLGEAVGALSLLAPRALWPLLPGGVPYYLRTPGASDGDKEAG